MAKKLNPDNNDSQYIRVKILLHVISKISRQEMGKQLKKDNLELSPLSVGVFCALGKKNCTLAQLSKRMMISPPTIIPVIDTLEKKGYLHRGTNPDDRRKNPLILTEKGRKLSAKMLKLRKSDNLVKSIKSLGKMRASVLEKLLEEIIQSMAGTKKLNELLKIIKENSNVN